MLNLIAHRAVPFVCLLFALLGCRPQTATQSAAVPEGAQGGAAIEDENAAQTPPLDAPSAEPAGTATATNPPPTPESGEPDEPVDGTPTTDTSAAPERETGAEVPSDTDTETASTAETEAEAEVDTETEAETEAEDTANSPTLPEQESADPRSNEALFQDLLDNHWRRIFPNGRRNVGGPQFFKYIYEQLATSHDLFKRYSKFYCGVSGAIVRPSEGDVGRFDTVKIKDNQGQCVIGKYYRCCWPCVCDIMKHARTEQATLRLPLDPSGTEATYWVLTMGDPCHRCDSSPCEDLPVQVQAYQCRDGITTNGLRVHNGRLTTGNEGRLVFALLHEAAPATETTATVTSELLNRCSPRINATPAELAQMGGMGNIFVDVALVNAESVPTNSFDDLCE